MSRPRQRLIAAARPTAETAVRSAVRSTVILTVVLIGLSVSWALSVARYGGPDETGHVLRAADVARGRLLGDTIPGLVSGFRTVTVPAPLASGDPMCFRHDKRIPATCGDSDDDLTGERTVGASAGTNPPWYYAMVGVPARALGDPADVLSYRIVATLLCAVVLAAAACRASGRGALVLLVALSPATWFLTGVVNPSSLEIALFLLAWIGVECLRTRAQHAFPAGSGPHRGPIPAGNAGGAVGTVCPAELMWIGAPLGVAILIRPIAVIGAGVVFATVFVLCRTDTRLGRRAWARLLAGPALAGVASLAWSTWSSVAVTDERAATDLSPMRVFRESLIGTADTVHEIGGQLGWLEFSAPWAVQWWWWAGVLACGTVAVRRGPDRGLRSSWLCLAVATIVIPIVFETVLAHRLGFIWQGRYSIPVALGLVVLGSTRWSAMVQARRRLFVVVVAAAAVAEVATMWATLRRYSVGTDGSWWFTGATWRPPVSPWLLLGANALLMTVLCGLAASGVVGQVSEPLRPPCDERR